MTSAVCPAPPRADAQRLQWDVFCRVIDNHGDVGVCWRLAADLAGRGHAVRLWIDEPAALSWLAPNGKAGVAAGAFDDAAHVQPADAVVEAFGCDPPARFIERMRNQHPSPFWINLEYLSAEPWVERSHGLPSPQQFGPGAGLTKWFFFPGFTAGTGGLIREPDLQARQRAFDGAAWLTAAGAARQAGERVVSLFCYANAPVADLLAGLALPDQAPALLLAAPGAASALVASVLGPGLHQGSVRALLMPYRSQLDFDHLLWASDLNFVRGEDSFVRAQLAGRPFVWQPYPQPDGAHAAKLAAFAALYFDARPRTPEQLAVSDFWRGWNSLAGDLPPLPALGPWSAHAESRRDQLLRTSVPANDLTSQLIGFANRKRAARS